MASRRSNGGGGGVGVSSGDVVDQKTYCKKHDKEFPNWKALHIHKIESKEHIVCYLCSQDFRTQGALKVHHDQLHSAEQNLECPGGCGKVFKRVGGLINHFEHNECKGGQATQAYYERRDEVETKTGQFDLIRETVGDGRLNDLPPPPAYREPSASGKSNLISLASTTEPQDPGQHYAMQGRAPPPPMEPDAMQFLTNMLSDHAAKNASDLENLMDADVLNTPWGEDYVTSKSKEYEASYPVLGLGPNSVANTLGSSSISATAKSTASIAKKAPNIPPFVRGVPPARPIIGSPSPAVPFATTRPLAENSFGGTTIGSQLDRIRPGTSSHQANTARPATASSLGGISVGAQPAATRSTASTASAAVRPAAAVNSSIKPVVSSPSSAWDDVIIAAAPPKPAPEASAGVAISHSWDRTVPPGRQGPRVESSPAPPASAWATKKQLFPDAPAAVKPPAEFMEKLTLASAPEEKYIGKEFGAHDPRDPAFQARIYYIPVLRKYKCPHVACFKSFDNESKFKAHLSSPKHIEDAQRLKCPHCLRYYDSATALTQHAESQGTRCKIRLQQEYDYYIDEITASTAVVAGLHSDDTIKYAVNENLAQGGSLSQRVGQANAKFLRAGEDTKAAYWKEHSVNW